MTGIFFTKDFRRNSMRHSLNIFIFSKWTKKSFPYNFLPPQSSKSGKSLLPFFSLGAGRVLTDVDFYQLYEASLRVVLPTPFTKGQPMRAPLFQSAATKERRREGIGYRLELLPNRNRPSQHLRRAA